MVFENVIHYCVDVVYSNDLLNGAAVLQYLAWDEQKHGCRHLSPHWKILDGLCGRFEVIFWIHSFRLQSTFFQPFKAYADGLIFNTDKQQEDEIIRLIHQYYGGNPHTYARILHFLAIDEDNNDSRADAPHWKMLKMLVTNPEVC